MLSAFCNAICNLQFAIYNLQFAIRNLQFAISILRPISTNFDQFRQAVYIMLQLDHQSSNLQFAICIQHCIAANTTLLSSFSIHSIVSTNFDRIWITRDAFRNISSFDQFRPDLDYARAHELACCSGRTKRRGHNYQNTALLSNFTMLSCARCCPDKSEHVQQNITPYCTMLLLVGSQFTIQ
jgi:hypothetical protein